MLSFIHAADIHLDSPLRGLERYEGAPVDAIRNASRRALENLVDYSIGEAIPLLVISGDVYDGEWKDYQTGLFFAKQMVRLRDAGTRVVMIHGNHDAQSIISKKLHLPDNVRVLSSRKPESFDIGELGVTVHGQSFPKQAVTENIVRNYPPAIPGRFNIGLLHTALGGAEGHANYAPCTLHDLKSMGYQYWALGHVHDYKELNAEPPVLFCGTLQGRHIHETGAKGCVRVDVDESGEISHSFIPLDVMRWAQVELDATDAANGDEICERLGDMLLPEIDNAEDRLLAVRVFITGTCPAHAELMRDEHALLNALRAKVMDTAFEQVWLEKVKLKTHAPVDLDALRDAPTPQGALLRTLEAAREDADQLPELNPDVQNLLDKLRAEAIPVPDIEDPAERAALLADVQDLLVPFIASAKESEA